MYGILYAAVLRSKRAAIDASLRNQDSFERPPEILPLSFHLNLILPSSARYPSMHLSAMELREAKRNRDITGPRLEQRTPKVLTRYYCLR